MPQRVEFGWTVSHRHTCAFRSADVLARICSLGRRLVRESSAICGGVACPSPPRCFDCVIPSRFSALPPWAGLKWLFLFEQAGSALLLCCRGRGLRGRPVGVVKRVVGELPIDLRCEGWRWTAGCQPARYHTVMLRFALRLNRDTVARARYSSAKCCNKSARQDMNGMLHDACEDGTDTGQMLMQLIEEHMERS